MSTSPLEKIALERFMAWLRPRFGARLAGVTLFGSRARGEGHEASDLDLLVHIHAATRSERGEVLDAAWELEAELGVAISPLVRDPATWNLAAPLARTIAEEGVAL